MSDPYKSALYQRNRMACLNLAGYECQIRRPGCTRLATTADHVLPLAMGGSHDLANLRAACWHCNSAGGAGLVNWRKAQRRQGRRSRAW